MLKCLLELLTSAFIFAMLLLVRADDVIEEALEDVDLALASGYPKDLRYKLYDRKIKLAANLGRNELAFNTRSEFIMALQVCIYLHY